MKMQTGMALMKNVKPIAGDHVDFVCPDGKTMFSVHIGKDGRSLQITAPDNAKVDGTLYSTRLAIEPNVTNAITIRTQPYE